MASRQPSEEFLAASRARAKLREREEKRRQDARRTRMRWAVWVFALILVIGLLADLRHVAGRLDRFRRTGRESRRGDAADIAGGLDGARYTDPAGRFSLVPPRNWSRVDHPEDSIFDVVFKGPYAMDMGIQTVVTNGLTFDRLVDNLRRVERSLSADTHMDFAYVGPYRAVKRSVQLFKGRVLMLDFVTGNLAHHIQIRIPPALYDEYEPVFLRLMQTYEPGRILPEK